MSNFYIIDTTEKLLDLSILESIHIINNRSEIYNNQTATIVNVLDAG